MHQNNLNMKKTSIFFLLFCGALNAQPNAEVDKQLKSIYSAALLEGQSYSWLDHLSNQIGGRLSGSLTQSELLNGVKKNWRLLV